MVQEKGHRQATVIEVVHHDLKLTIKSFPPSMNIVFTISEAEKELNQRPRPEQIIAQVAATTGISADRITGPSREAEVVKARDQVIFILFYGECMTTTEIGRILNRDHSSIVASVRRSRAAEESSKPSS